MDDAQRNHDQMEEDGGEEFTTRAANDDPIIPLEQVQPFTNKFRLHLLCILVTPLEMVGKEGKKKATIAFGTNNSLMIGLHIWLSPKDAADHVAAMRGILSQFTAGATYMISGVQIRPTRSDWYPVGTLERELVIPDPHIFSLQQVFNADRIFYIPDFSDDHTCIFQECRPYNLHFFVREVTPTRIVANGKQVRNIHVSHPRADQYLSMALWGPVLTAIELEVGDYISVQNAYMIKQTVTVKAWTIILKETPPAGMAAVPFDRDTVTAYHLGALATHNMTLDRSFGHIQGVVHRVENPNMRLICKICNKEAVQSARGDTADCVACGQILGSETMWQFRATGVHLVHPDGGDPIRVVVLAPYVPVLLDCLAPQYMQRSQAAQAHILGRHRNRPLRLTVDCRDKTFWSSHVQYLAPANPAA